MGPPPLARQPPGSKNATNRSPLSRVQRTARDRRCWRKKLVHPDKKKIINAPDSARCRSKLPTPRGRCSRRHANRSCPICLSSAPPNPAQRHCITTSKSIRKCSYPSAIKETNYMAFYNGLPPLAGPGDKIALRWAEHHDVAGISGVVPRPESGSGGGRCQPGVFVLSDTCLSGLRSFARRPKIVMILRNPIDCTFSMYAMMRRDGREPCRTFAEAFAESPARMAAGWEWAWDYQQGFMLADRVAAYLQAFPKQQVFIRRYEELQNHPQRFYRELNSFVGIDDIDLEDANKRENTSPTRGQMLRKKKLGRWMLRTARVAGWLTPPALKTTCDSDFWTRRRLC